MVQILKRAVLLLALTTAPAFAQILQSPNGGTGQDSSGWSGCATVTAGVWSYAACPVTKALVSHQWLTSYDATTGTFGRTQPACSDLSDASTGCSTTVGTAATHAASDFLSSSTVLAGTLALVSHKFFVSYDASTGIFVAGQPACGDLSDSGTACTAASSSFLASSTVLPATSAAATHNFLTSYTAGTGAFTKAQPVCSDLSDSASGCSTAAYTLLAATSSVLGGVKPDGTSILNTAGAISATAASVGADASGAAAARAGTGTCTTGQYENQDRIGGPSCAQVDYSQLSGTPTIPATIPSGAIMFIKTGTCPTGWTQESGFIGLYILATTAAAGDVGTTGGSTSYTPDGSATVTSLTAAAQTFTGASSTVPAETVNSLTAAAQGFTGDTTTVPAETVNALTAAAQGFTGDTTTVPAETVNSLTAAGQIFTGSSVTSGGTSAGTPAGTNTLGAYTPGVISWPVNVPTNGSGAYTPGAISWPAGVPTFSGTPFSSVINHTHTVTVTWNVQGGTTAATTGTHVMTSTATGGSARVPTTGDVVSATTANPAGGVASITPAGTVAWPAGVPTIGAGTFTQPTISWPANPPTIGAGTFTQPTFTGTAMGTHTHTVTAAGTNGSSGVTGTLNSTSITPLGHNATSGVTGTLNSTSITPLGHNAASGVTGTLNSTTVTPLGSNAASNVTGTIGFTGTPATIQPPFVKLIPCSKN